MISRLSNMIIISTNFLTYLNYSAFQIKSADWAYSTFGQSISVAKGIVWLSSGHWVIILFT